MRIVREFKNKSTDHCQPVIFGKLPPLPLAAIADGNIIRIHFGDQLVFAMRNADVQRRACTDVFRQADQVLVYVSRMEQTEEALQAVADGMGGDVKMEKIRELLYCDLYLIARK